MKYNIFIDQKSIVENDLDMDIKDAVIIDFMRSLLESPKIDKLIFNKRVYFWMKSSHFVKENPLLGIKSSDGLYRRLLKLHNIGLISPHPDNKKLNKSYYCLTDLFHNIFSSDDVDNLRMKIGRSEGTSGRKSEGGTDENRKVPTDENRKDNTIIYYNTINDYNKQEFFKKNSRDKNLHNFFIESFNSAYYNCFGIKYKYEQKDFPHVYPIIDQVYERLVEVLLREEVTIEEVESGIKFFIEGAISLRSNYFLSNFNIPVLRSSCRDIFLKLSEKNKQNGNQQSINNKQSSFDKGRDAQQIFSQFVSETVTNR